MQDFELLGYVLFVVICVLEGLWISSLVKHFEGIGKLICQICLSLILPVGCICLCYNVFFGATDVERIRDNKELDIVASKIIMEKDGWKNNGKYIIVPTSFFKGVMFDQGGVSLPAASLDVSWGGIDDYAHSLGYRSVTKEELEEVESSGIDDTLWSAKPCISVVDKSKPLFRVDFWCRQPQSTNAVSGRANTGGVGTATVAAEGFCLIMEFPDLVGYNLPQGKVVLIRLDYKP